MATIILKDQEIKLKVGKDPIINVSGKVIIKEINALIDNNYIINLEENSSLEYIKKDKNFASNINIIINASSNTKINFNYAFECLKPCKVNILTNLNGNNIKNNIKIHGVTSKRGSSYIEANAIVKENTMDNEINEEIKVLKLNDEESIIKPNLQVSTNNIMASHNTTCKMIDSQSLFYLTSKGLSKAKVIKLIKEGFLNNLK